MSFLMALCALRTCERQMQIKRTKEEVPWQAETSVMCRFQSDPLPESALTVGQRLWHSDENPSVAVGGAGREIPG